MKNRVGIRLMMLRKEIGATQEEAAKYLGITQSNYGRKEKDDKRISVADLVVLSKFLGIPIEQIISEKPLI